MPKPVKTQSRDLFRYEQVASQVKQLIKKGTYRPGDRIPSVRQMSQQQGVSISSVLQAYLQLESRGVDRSASAIGILRLPARRLASPGTRNLLARSRPQPCQPARSGDDGDARFLNPNLAQLGAAMPNLELLPTERMNRIMAGLARTCQQRDAPVPTSARSGSPAHPDREAVCEQRMSILPKRHCDHIRWDRGD